MLSLLNSDAFYSCGLVLLECTFVLVSFLLLHGMKRFIGSAPFYAAFGVAFVFMHLISAAGLTLLLDRMGMEIYISTGTLLIPCLGSLLVVYATDGTLAVQRLIFAVMAVFGIFAYLSSLTILQCGWHGYSVSQGMLADTLERLLKTSDQYMAATVVSFTFDLFVIPVVFQQLRNKKCGILLSTLAALVIGHFCDQFIFLSVFYWGKPQYLYLLKNQLIPQTFLTAWTGLLTAVYLSRLDDGEQIGETRHPLDIVLSFFGSYGKTKLLEQNLQESEQRWRTIIQNAGDAILITDENLFIVDANKSALDFFSVKHVSDVIGRSIEDAVIPPAKLQVLPAENSSFQLKLTGNGETKLLEIHQSKISIDGLPAFVNIGRDITERERLAQEREALRNENAHRQRLEAIGRLAGGIAHDFNNHIHAINGHLDLIYMGDVTEESMRHLEKIDAIAQQAGKLTSQLLGYARKGRRQNKRMLLDSVVRDSLELFIPDSRTGLTLEKKFQSAEIMIEGDHTQLTQAVLNIMLNARDAMSELPEKQRNLSIGVGSPEWVHAVPRKPNDVPESCNGWGCIRIEDSGPGIPKEIREKIFEPFFTTKPIGQGTGMGLSMAYGVSLEHFGWIQYDDSPSGGAAFTLFLPVYQPSTRAENPSIPVPVSAERP